MVTVLLVLAGAIAGGPLRHLADRAVRPWRGRVVAWDVLVSNVGGSLLLGFLAGLPTGDASTQFVASVIWGAFVTYATFGNGTLRLVREEATARAMIYAAASLSSGLGAALCGVALADVVTPN